MTGWFYKVSQDEELNWERGERQNKDKGSNRGQREAQDPVKQVRDHRTLSLLA